MPEEKYTLKYSQNRTYKPNYDSYVMFWTELGYIGFVTTL